MTAYRTLPGLPPYGPMATSFPGSFARSGREGYVVEFLPDTSQAWIGNFGPGLGGYSGVHSHPDGTDVVVFFKGSGYVIDLATRELKRELASAVASVWEVESPRGLVCDRQGLAFFHIGPAGLTWHTRRLSFDGFRDVALTPDRIVGLACGLGGSWVPFEVDLATGASDGGSVPREIDRDWETLAK